MKVISNKVVAKWVSASVVVGLMMVGSWAHATATDANICNKMVVPGIGIGASGNPTHFIGNVIALGADDWVSCGIPNSNYLGTTATVDIFVDDRNAEEEFSCTFVVRDLVNGVEVGTDTVSSSGTGEQTITANVATSGFNTRDLAYTVNCSMPKIFGSNFISSLLGFHLY